MSVDRRATGIAGAAGVAVGVVLMGSIGFAALTDHDRPAPDRAELTSDVDEVLPTSTTTTPVEPAPQPAEPPAEEQAPPVVEPAPQVAPTPPPAPAAAPVEVVEEPPATTPTTTGDNWRCFAYEVNDPACPPGSIGHPDTPTDDQ